MANEIEAVNTIAIADIEKVNTLTDDEIEKINTLEFAGIVYPSWAGSRALIYGGSSYEPGGAHSDATTWVLYKTMASESNTADFDQLQSGRESGKGSGSNGTRAIFGGGLMWDSGVVTYSDAIDYVTVATLNSANDFGDIKNGTNRQGGSDGASNGTLCFFNGGRNASNYDDGMEYVNISSTGDGQIAGNLEAEMALHATTNGDSKYLVVGGRLGTANAPLRTVSTHDFHASNGATDFGSVTVFYMYSPCAVSSTTRVVMSSSGYAGTGWSGYSGDSIHYFTLSSPATSVDDGYSIVAPVHYMSGTSDGTTGEFYGGEGTGSFFRNDIQKITIASLADAVDIGDLTHPDFNWDEHTYSAVSGAGFMASQTGT